MAIVRRGIDGTPGIVRPTRAAGWSAAVLVAAGLLTGCGHSDTHRAAPSPAIVPPPPSSDREGAVFAMAPIGTVANKKGGPVELRLDPAYAPGLLGLDQWSHVDVFYWFDKNDNAMQRRILQVHPRGNRANPLTGVFACRAPVRPNLIALTTCRILGLEDNVVRVDAIDAFDGTPILDLKPHVPGVDPRTESFRVPEWTGRKPDAPLLR